MAKEQIKQCPVCGCTSFVEVFFCEDYLISHEKFPINRCLSCSFCFTQAIPDVATIQSYYQTDDYVSHSDTKEGVVNKIYHAVRKRMLFRKAKIVETYVKSGKLLDVGCGTGYFAETMQKRGWNISAVEPSVSAASVAQEKLKLKIEHSLNSEEFSKKEFDVITLWHVLEHLIDLNASMEQLHNLLADKGVLIIAVPNIQSLDAEKYKQYWAAYDVPRHIWHFSSETLELLVQKYGFQLVEIYSMPFDAFYISMLSEKNKKSKFPFLKGVLFGTGSYFKCLFNKQKSSSLIFILKNK